MCLSPPAEGPRSSPRESPAPAPRHQSARAEPVWQAPRESGQSLVSPPEVQLAQQVRAARPLGSFALAGVSAAAIAHSAREQLRQAAYNYTRQYRSAASAPAGDTLILAGHQPQLFHPGVWYKNFLLSRLGRSTSSAVVNLVIDADLCKTAWERVPGGSRAAPRIDRIPLDESLAALPFERRHLVSTAVFAGFPRAVRQQMADLTAAPCVAELWPHVLERARATGNLGAALSQGRHRWEEDWGWSTWELPLSHLCELPATASFFAEILARPEEFRSAYNGAVAGYRRQHKLRNARHPVPDLELDAGWCEAPFWIWSDATPHRGRPFVRRQGDTVRISDRRGLDLTLPCRGGANPDTAAELATWSARGIRLRTRALTTTLLARLLLCDLFLHGIGGGKYDRVTDDLTARFFGVTLAPYAVVSATLHLPSVAARVSPADVGQVATRLRELAWQPERFLNPADDPQVAELLGEKARLLAQPTARHHTRAWCQQVLAINAELQRTLAPIKDDNERLLAERRGALRASRIWHARDYAFCLYPRDTLEELFRSQKAEGKSQK